jgi:hypothetical protein
MCLARTARLALVAGLAAILGAATAGSSRASLPQWPNLPPLATETPTVSLGEVWKHPLDHLGKTMQVTFQVQALPATWNPYLTRFGPGDWVAVSVWGDDQFLWERAEFDRPLGLLFARRGTGMAQELAEAASYQRFSAEVVERQVFMGKPWIEIRSLKRHEQHLTEGSLLHASRAVTLMGAEQWELAKEDLARALATDLPVHARAELERLRSLCIDRQVKKGPRPSAPPPKKGKK